jgi:divalent metal cation (Fe/Co/Zn/Cd) transporter
MLSSAVVLVGMVFVATGYVAADAIAALIVAGFILTAAIKLGRRSFDALVDAAPLGADGVIEGLVSPIPEVLRVERTRVRAAGPTLFVELAVAVSRSLPFERVSAVKAEIAEAVHREFPEAELTIVAEPRAVEDETIETSVRVIAANCGAAIHRLTIQRIGRKLSISLDIEVKAELSVDQAHGVASELEAAIREELGQDVEIDTHIEPMSADWLDGREVGNEQYRAVQRLLISAAERGGIVEDIHNVRIRATDLGLIVNFHCRLPPDMLVTEAHAAVDDVERKVRSANPEVARVIGHAEPQRAR